MIKVLHIVCFPELYGTQRNIFSTAKCLDRSLFEPLIAAPADPRFEGRAASAGAEFIPAPMRGLSDMKSVSLLRGVIRKKNIGLLHCHLGISSFLGLLAVRGMDVPAVATRHFINDRYTTITNPAVYRAYLQMYRWMNSRFAKVICVSAAVRDAIVEREGVSSSRCEVIHNGIPLPAGRALPSLPAGVSAPAGRKVIVSLSRLTPEKGLETLIRAMAECVRKNGPLTLIIAGEGPLRGSLEALAASLGVGEYVFFPGFVDDTPGLLAAADVFVLSATAEPFGIALIEAMAAGLPCVASASGGPLEIIQPGRSGLLVPPSDHYALANAISSILSDDEFAASLARKAAEEAKRFDETAIAGRIASLYTSVLTGAGRG